MVNILLVGSNYTGKPYALNGCINDAKRLYKMFTEEMNIPSKNITLLIDEAGYEYPTKENILKYLNNAAMNSSKNGYIEFVFTFSGHGTYLRDMNNDEIDKRDECIVPYDTDTSGYIVDDEIYNILSKFDSKSKIFLLFDSCNSGSITDLPNSYAPGKNNYITMKLSKKSNLNSNIICFSGCKDDSYSYEYYDDKGIPVGAFTYFFYKVLKQYNFNITLKQLLLSVNSYLSNAKIGQTPILTCTKKLDSNYNLFNRNINKNIILTQCKGCPKKQINMK